MLFGKTFHLFRSLRKDSHTAVERKGMYKNKPKSHRPCLLKLPHVSHEPTLEARLVFSKIMLVVATIAKRTSRPR